MAFVYAYFFSSFFCFDMSLNIDCYPAGVSNKHCLLSFFSFLQTRLVVGSVFSLPIRKFACMISGCGTFLH